MWLAFSRPVWLLLLPAAAALLWHSGRASYADLGGARRWVAWGVRSIIVVALIFAISGVQLVRRSRDVTVVFALDSSYSVSPDEHARALDFVREAVRRRRAHDHAALVVFGREAMVESEDLRRPEDVQIASQPAPSHTDIGAAMRLALGLIPPESAGKIVLLSDGNENVGSAANEALAAQAGRVPVDVVPLRTRGVQDALVREVSLPSDAKQGEPFPLRVTLEATRPAEAALTIAADGRPVARRSVTLPAGTTSLKVPVSLSNTGFHRVDVLLESAGDECAANNRGQGFVRIKGKPRVLVLDSEPADARDLARGLGKQDIVVDVGGPAAMPTNAADVERYDSVILSNYPAYRMDNRQMAMLRDATRNLGVGLGMVGGELSFGAGGYYRTPIEEALPVDMDLRKHRVYPAAAVLLVIDTSGSMGMMEGGVEKIQLAAEAACAVVDLLQPYDAVGVLASDPRPTLVAKLRRVEDAAAIKRDIRSLRAGGGGIACFPSLAAAYEVLSKDDSAVRHIIMLADGSDCDEQAGSFPLVAKMAAEKMTVTTVAFGGGPHVPYLQRVAELGGGHFYLTERASDLKKIFTRETLTIARSVLVEEPFQAALADETPLVAGIDWASSPPLLGYVATTPKSLARVPLLSHKQDPVLAHWQYGLGRSIAFTSDAKAHWAAHWLGWQGFPKFWGQAVRWTLRQLATEVLYPRVELTGDKAHIVVEAVGQDGSLLNGLAMRASVNLPGGTTAEAPLGQTAPGRYEATVDAPDSGTYVVGLSASGPNGFEAHQTLGFSVAYPPDFADTETAEGFLTSLAQQTGGKVLASPAEAFASTSAAPRVPTDIWRPMLWLAALALPLDVAVRRLVLRREDVAALARPVVSIAGRLRRRTPKTPPRAETMERLLARKGAVRPQQPPEVAPAPPAPISAPTAEQEAPRPEEEARKRQPRPAEPTTRRLLEAKRRRRRTEE